MAETTSVPEGTPSPPAAWEDYVDLFFTPSDVFARRARSSPWLPLLVVTVAMGVLGYVNAALLEPMMAAEFNRGIAATLRENPSITPEAVASMRRLSLRIGRFSGFLVPIGVLLTGTVTWVLGKAFEARQSYRAALLVAAFAFMPRVLEAGVNELQGLIVDPATMDGRFRLTFGVGRFLDPDTTSPILLALVGRIDLFTLWVTFLLGLGLSITGRIPRARALLVAGLFWILGALPLVLAAARS